jgi:hypothetical protein
MIKKMGLRLCPGEAFSLPPAQPPWKTLFPSEESCDISKNHVTSRRESMKSSPGYTGQLYLLACFLKKDVDFKRRQKVFVVEI